MKLFKADFEPVFSVGCGLVILAENVQEATDMASETIMHTNTFSLEEIPLDKPKVVFYDDGEY